MAERSAGDLTVANMPAAERPDSLAHSVYTTIRQAIIDGRLQPATRVTETGLAKQLGVSKTPVREALLRLKEIGLIEADGVSAGGRIITPSETEIRDTYEVRETLETSSARLAAERGDMDMLLEARREAERTVVAADRRDHGAYREADEAFHAMIARAGGNRRLARLIDDTNALISVLRQRAVPGVDASPLCASHHMRISEALIARDGDQAVELMREHVRYVATEILAHFAARG